MFITIFSILTIFIGDQATSEWPIRECGWSLFTAAAGEVTTPTCMGYNLFWLITWFISGFETMFWGQAMTGNSAMIDAYMVWMSIIGFWGGWLYVVPVIFWIPLWIPTLAVEGATALDWVMGWESIAIIMILIIQELFHFIWIPGSVRWAEFATGNDYRMYDYTRWGKTDEELVELEREENANTQDLLEEELEEGEVLFTW